MKSEERKKGRKKWIGVDFDGTLAYHEPGAPLTEFGEPVPSMVRRVKRWIELGWTVKIFTARVSSMYPDAGVQRGMIRAWCRRNIGHDLEVTAEKDGAMEELWDDRAVSVKRNTGEWVCADSTAEDVE